MQKILIFGNAAAGKSTLAKKIAKKQGLAHLDLDTLAWLATSPPQRKRLSDSAIEIDNFTQQHSSWVIEGCYSDLLELLTSNNAADHDNVKNKAFANEIIFLDIAINRCITHAENRSWEAHKYPSKQAQDDNLAMLIDWIKAYETRSDTFSKQAHQQLYTRFVGKKNIITSID
ncbi:shikimate kinase [Colwellia hornerae]|uniref:Shikimate kinase n=1 Tax=Colwellia hornerae TaxID=89402 RepID=A0A5C6QRM8_9GAMM|nr:shikimate kinase [Colwellia hornerae]TWX57734.1 shikimate kinase [Colwellia hornerae]TWX62535.1 shikimate kinase [Colwellia hornerae]TWX71447.1 shikimate kinase [Colwellia hornerae]